jgi:hypothetical protein
VREGEETEAPTLDEVGNALDKLKNNRPVQISFKFNGS